MPPSGTVRLHGAASVVDALVRLHAAAVEKATGLALAVDRSNAGKGLVDLVAGRCDVALASASLEATLEAARTAGLAGPAPDLRMQVVATSEIVFVVHPSNPVRRLSRQQIRDVHTGRIAAWRELGGADLPIVVLTDAAASATRSLVRQVVLGGADYAPGARALAAVKDVADEVARDPAAIGGLGLEFVDRSRVAVVETERIERPLAFVTLGPPADAAARVIEAYRALAASGPIPALAPGPSFVG
ncbi:MAG TPA: substrate-binding domain-containing protein [Anaeromyxobacteraceae bacterium]|nr:substrate-binding domain-containing protein [Anaeromyxobacteraceae bacterium]